MCPFHITILFCCFFVAQVESHALWWRKAYRLRVRREQWLGRGDGVLFQGRDSGGTYARATQTKDPTNTSERSGKLVGFVWQKAQGQEGALPATWTESGPSHHCTRTESGPSHHRTWTESGTSHHCWEKSTAQVHGPERHLSKGRHKGGKDEGWVKCRYCWRRVRPNVSSRSQHEFWNINCLRWQFVAEGHPWGEACKLAQACKDRREAAEADPRAEMPAPKRLRLCEKDSKEKKHHKDRKGKSKKDKKPTVAVVHRKKEKKHKKRRQETSSPSPVIVRKKPTRPRSSGSSDSGGHERKEGRAKRQAPRTLVINIPRWGSRGWFAMFCVSRPSVHVWWPDWQGNRNLDAATKGAWEFISETAYSQRVCTVQSAVGLYFGVEQKKLFFSRNL